MRFEFNGQQCEYDYATHFIKSRKDPLVSLNDEYEFEASENTFGPAEGKDGQLETSVILHKSKEDVPWLEGVRIFNPNNASNTLGKTPAYAATVSCEEINRSGLSIEWEPTKTLPNHGNIRSWNIERLSEQLSEIAGSTEITTNPTRGKEFQNMIEMRKQHDIACKKKQQR